MIADSNGDRCGDTRPLWTTGLSPPDPWPSLRQPGYLQLDQVRHPKHRVWGYDRTLKVRNFRSTKVGNFQSQLTGSPGRIRRVMIVALARKLLIALWRSPRPASCRLAPSSPDRETALFQTGRSRPGLGRVASGRDSTGLKHADREMGPAPGTLRPQQAGSRDGSGAPSPKNLPDKRWVCAQARRCEKRSDLATR